MNSNAIKSRLSQITAVAAVILIGAVVILIATSGPPTSSSSASTSGSGSSGGDTVDISNFKFDPPDLTVSTGSKVTFTNEDTALHTGTADDGAFDTGDLAKGDSKTVTLDKAGTFTYHCTFHAFMTGTITVK